MAGDPLHTRLCDDFGMEFPVIAFTHCKDVVAAVVNAGGLACLGEAGHLPDEIEADVKWLRDRVGTKPFGVDLLIPASAPPTGTREEFESQVPQEYWDWMERVKKEFNIPPPKPRSPQELRRREFGMTQENARKQIDTVLELRVPILASGLGNPAFILDAAHARGLKVIGLIGNVRQALREHEAGIDYIVAQGYDSAGHTGEIGTFSLIPQVVDAVKPTPVIGAGGFGCGRHLAAALCLGAIGMWTGTIWQLSRESDTDMIGKQKLLDATERDTNRSRSFSGKPSRWLKTRWTEMWDAPGALPFLPMPLQGVVGQDILASVNDYKIVDFFNVPAGQAVGMLHEMKPAAQILYDIIEEARDTFDRLAPVPV